MTTIAVVGVGAIGGTLAAHLWASNVDVPISLCARSPINKLVVEFKGEKISVEQKYLTENLLIDPNQAQRVDWVWFATKAHQTKAAAIWLEHLCDQHTNVAVLQNGVEHRERLMPYVNPAQIVPVVVDCPAVKNTDGVIQQKAEATLVVENSQSGKAFQALFNNTRITVNLSDDLNTVAWKKLCLNVAGGAIAALTDQPLAVLHQPGMAELAKQLILECIAVGRSEGASLDNDLADDIVQNMLIHSRESLTSMLVDKRAGKLLEVDARNGAVVRLGEKYGIDTPYNRMATTVLLAANH